MKCWTEKVQRWVPNWEIWICNWFLLSQNFPISRPSANTLITADQFFEIIQLSEVCHGIIIRSSNIVRDLRISFKIKALRNSRYEHFEIHIKWKFHQMVEVHFIGKYEGCYWDLTAKILAHTGKESSCALHARFCVIDDWVRSVGEEVLLVYCPGGCRNSHKATPWISSFVSIGDRLFYVTLCHQHPSTCKLWEWSSVLQNRQLFRINACTGKSDLVLNIFELSLPLVSVFGSFSSKFDLFIK